jgi:hypothetical protein
VVWCGFVRSYSKERLIAQCLEESREGIEGGEGTGRRLRKRKVEEEEEQDED